MRKNAKKKGSFAKFLFGFIIFLIISSVLVSTALSFLNYSTNQKAFENFGYFDENGFINEQSELTNFKFGFSSFDTNGCGSIALYNVLKLANKTETLPNIIKQMDLYGQNAFGYLGTNPVSMVFYLRSKGIDASITFNKSEFNSFASTSNASIFCSLSFSGGHYQVLHSENEGVFQTLNPKSSKTMQELLAETDTSFLHFLIYTKF
ncbi:MAG: hypothetical protein WCR30_01090 [Clostridia bacterium]